MWQSQEQCTPSHSTNSLHGPLQHPALLAPHAPAGIGYLQHSHGPPPRFPLAGLPTNKLMPRAANPMPGTLPGVSRHRLQQIAEAQQQHTSSRMAFMHKQPRPAPSRQLHFADPCGESLSLSQSENAMYDSSQQFIMTQPSELPLAAYQVP